MHAKPIQRFFFYLFMYIEYNNDHDIVPQKEMLALTFQVNEYK